MNFLRQRFALPALLTAAAGIPYLATQESWLGTSPAETEAVSSDPAQPAAWAPGFDSAYTHGDNAERPPLNGADVSIAGPQAEDFAAIFRFDVSPQWVTQHWPRVTTVLAESDLQGLRAPLMTGTDPDDLAGSVTYYFNARHEVQRIAFHGYSGDASKVAQLATEKFGMRAEPTLHAGLYVSKWNGYPSSVLRIARAPIMTHNSPHSQVQVVLELNRPGAYYGLSQEMRRMLQGDRYTQRWR